MLKNDKQNLSRLEFLSALADGPWEPRITVKDKVQELHEQAKPWALQQLQVTLKTLQKPTVAECSVLLRAARVYGGINFLQERCVNWLLFTDDTLTAIIPQCSASACRSCGPAISPRVCEQGIL